MFPRCESREGGERQIERHPLARGESLGRRERDLVFGVVADSRSVEYAVGAEVDELDAECGGLGRVRRPDVHPEVRHVRGVHRLRGEFDPREDEPGVELDRIPCDLDVGQVGGVPFGGPGVHVHVVIAVAEERDHAVGRVGGRGRTGRRARQDRHRNGNRRARAADRGRDGRLAVGHGLDDSIRTDRGDRLVGGSPVRRRRRNLVAVGVGGGQRDPTLLVEGRQRDRLGIQGDRRGVLHDRHGAARAQTGMGRGDGGFADAGRGHESVGVHCRRSVVVGGPVHRRGGDGVPVRVLNLGGESYRVAERGERGGLGRDRHRGRILTDRDRRRTGGGSRSRSDGGLADAGRGHESG